MRTVTISLDIWCDYDTELVSPVYCVYVDSLLLLENPFVWAPMTQFIREHIEVNLFPGEHYLSIENDVSDNIMVWFSLSNLQVDGVLVPTANGSSNAKFIV